MRNSRGCYGRSHAVAPQNVPLRLAAVVGLMLAIIGLVLFGPGCDGHHDCAAGDSHCQDDGGTADATGDDGSPADGDGGGNPTDDFANLRLVIPGIYHWTESSSGYDGDDGLNANLQDTDEPGCNAGQIILDGVYSQWACIHDPANLIAWGCGGACGHSTCCAEAAFPILLCDCEALGRDFGPSIKAWCLSKGHAQTDCGPGGVRFTDTDTSEPNVETAVKQACGQRDGGAGPCPFH